MIHETTNELRNLTSMGVNRLQPPHATPPDNKKKGIHRVSIPPAGHTTAESTRRPQLCM
jgi:hypothetical protein